MWLIGQKKRHKVGISNPWRDLKGREGLKEQTLPWGVSGSIHRVGFPVPRSYSEEKRYLGCWENCWDRKKGWRTLDSTSKECVCAGLPTNRVERALHRQLLSHYTSKPLGYKPQLDHSIPQLDARSGLLGPRKSQSSYAETAWGVVWV